MSRPRRPKRLPVSICKVFRHFPAEAVRFLHIGALLAAAGPASRPAKVEDHSGDDCVRAIFKGDKAIRHFGTFRVLSAHIRHLAISNVCESLVRNVQPYTNVKRMCSFSRLLGAAGWLYPGIAAAMAIFLAAGRVWASTPTSGPRGFHQGFSGGGDTTGIVWQMLAATLVVLFVGVVAILVIKKLLPRLAKSSGRRISVLETAYLGPHKSVHLLQVGARKVLVGSSRDGVVELGDVTDAFAADYSEVARSVEAEKPPAAVAVAGSLNQPGTG